MNLFLKLRERLKKLYFDLDWKHRGFWFGVCISFLTGAVLTVAVLKTGLLTNLFVSPSPSLQIVHQGHLDTVLVDNIPAVSFQSYINQEIDAKTGESQSKSDSLGVIVHYTNHENAPDACTRKLVKLPTKNALVADWILLANDKSCEIRRKIMNAQSNGFSSIIIFTSSNSPFENFTLVHQFWKENFSKKEFTIDVHFISHFDGEVIKDEFSYPLNPGYSLRMSPNFKWWGWAEFTFEFGNLIPFIFNILMRPEVSIYQATFLVTFTRLIFIFLVVVSFPLGILFLGILFLGIFWTNLMSLLAQPQPQSLPPQLSPAPLLPQRAEPPVPPQTDYNVMIQAIIQRIQSNDQTITPGTFIRLQYPNRLPKRYLLLIRDQFETCYLDYYKEDQGADVKKDLSVEFIGEQAIDYGGPTKEYLCMLRTALTNGVQEGKTIFTGLPNHRILVWDPKLLQEGCYFAAGKAICDVAYGLNYALAGLSTSLMQQIAKDENDEGVTDQSQNPLTYHRDDLASDQDVLLAYDVLTKLMEFKIVSPEEITAAVLTLKEYGVLNSLEDLVKRCNRIAISFFHERLFHAFLVRIRRPAIQQFKAGLEAGGLFEYSKIFPTSGISSVFPRVEGTSIEVEILKRKILFLNGEILSSTEDNEAHNVLRYIDEIKEDQNRMKHLLLQWTGSEDLPIGMLRVQSLTKYELFFSSCDSVLQTSSHLDYDTFKLLVEDSGPGFNHV